MAAIIYMEQTLALIHSQSPETVEAIVQSGEIRQTESGIRYLIIPEEIEDEQ